MTLDTWVSLAAIAAGFAGVTGYLRSALLDIRDEMVALRTELKSDIAGCHNATDNTRTELKADIAGCHNAIHNTRTELKADIAGCHNATDNTRTELKADIAGCHNAIHNTRTELKSDIADLRSELKGDIAGLRTAVATLDDRVYNLNTSVTGLLTRETHRSQTG